MTPEQLKASILQYAVQGQLVEQRAEEGNADSLYNELQTAKEQLLKAKIIKKDKITDEDETEPPFEIPENWKWVKVTDCISNKSGLSYNKGNLEVKSDTMIRVMRGGNIADMNYSFKSDDVMIASEYVKPELYLRKNTLITPAVTSLEHIGKMARIDQDYDNTVVGGFVLMLTPHIDNDILSQYLLVAFSSPYFRDFCRKIVNKSGQAFYNLSREKMMQLYVPLPPLEEQYRIVAKIEELLPYVDRYAVSYEKLEQFNAKFPEDMKKSILQYAIQGKLVEQRADEGNAEDLYQQIQEEKQKLIKEGKIKKEKPLAEITEDEIPFDIPESWKWVRLSDVIDVRDGTHDTPGYIPIGYPLITGKDFYNGYFELSKTKYISEDDYNEIIKRSKVDIGDIIFSMIGGNIGSMIVINKDNYFDMAIKNVALFKQYDYELSLTSYLEIFLRSQVSKMQSIAKGGAQSFVSLNLLRNYLFPLPPLKEQERIVAKINEMLPYCERLKR